VNKISVDGKSRKQGANIFRKGLTNILLKGIKNNVLSEDVMTFTIFMKLAAHFVS
jgi:hypothetical protein